MSLIVTKFGGTSVATPERILKAAQRLVDYQQQGNKVVAVVSAMGKSTDDLLALAHEVNPAPPARELDVLLTTGELVSMSILAMAVASLGKKAKSFTGHQAGIVTTTKHNKAQIAQIKAGRIEQALDDGNIVIVAGFQGSTKTGELTTLGRGGSDTSAVALAAALKADLCEIYSDVDGVYTADPRVVPRAKKLESISYEEMLELAAAGSGVLQMRAVEFARNYKVTLCCRSAFSSNPGTIVREEAVEQAIVSGIAYDNSEAKITIRGVPDTAGIAASVFSAIAKANINVDMIVQNISEHGYTDITFTAPAGDLDRLCPVLQKQVDTLGAREYLVDSSITKLSLVGAGLRTNPGIAAKMFKVLSESAINIEMISTSAIRISVVIDAKNSERAQQALHTAFDLDSDQVFKEETLSAEEQAAKANKGR
ncbi:MAG: aspartate kinase [Coriobacteriales bacterium]|jgi:aspartate kinase|nr:aspartate kinase [Coriobacteriales bacterium]